MIIEAGEAAESDLKHVLTELEKGKEKQRVEESSGEQPALHGEWWRRRQLWGTRGRRESDTPSWRQSWSTFTLTLMFPESHSPAGSWFRISRSASVWAQAGNKQRSRVWTQELWKEWSPWGRAELCSHIWGVPVLGRLQMTLWRRETTRHYQAAASSDHPSIHTNLVCCFRDPGEQGSTWTEGWWPT